MIVSVTRVIYNYFRVGAIYQRSIRIRCDIHFFFFSSRRRHTRSLCDWSSDVCSSDLRYPVAGGHRARVARPLTLAGYRLEQGLDVEVAMTVPHFLEELYPNPMQFDLDRFRPARNEHRKPGAYAPFGLGDHTCLGAGIAEVQLLVTMATLLSNYTLQFDPPDYHLVIEEHPPPIPGNNFQVLVREQRLSSRPEGRI